MSITASVYKRCFLQKRTVLAVVERLLGTLRSDNGDGNGNLRSLGRGEVGDVGVPAKIEITIFTSESEDAIVIFHAVTQQQVFRKHAQVS